MPDLADFLFQFVLYICRKCHDEIHPENEWLLKFKQKELEFERRITELIRCRDEDGKFIIELKENARKLNETIIRQQEQVRQLESKSETTLTHHLELKLQGKNKRIIELMKEIIKVKQFIKKYERLSQIVKNMNKNRKQPVTICGLCEDEVNGVKQIDTENFGEEPVISQEQIRQP